MRLPAALLNPSQGLPAFTGARRPVGATRPARGSAMTVVGSPTMRVIRSAEGGAKTLLRRNMANADLLSDDDLKTLQALMAQVEDAAKRLSAGGLSYRDLRRMGNPYGKGIRRGLGRLRGAGRGVSNMAIANRHSGAYQDAWKGSLQRDKSGVTFILDNEDGVAAFLAFGTKTLRAHGPQVTAVASHLAAIDAEWRRLGKVAAARNNALNQVAIVPGRRGGVQSI